MYPYVRNPRVLGLGEVMDDPGVINGDESMFSKLLLFENRTIDGHAPYLPNRELSAYKMAGVDTDHEATSFEYALEEVRRGIHVHIREGSAAHNLKDIVEGIVRTGIDTEYFSFCTDDKHIEDILRDGHISYNVKLAVSLGMNPVQAIKMATINTAKCYGLKHLGAISPGFQADFVVLDNLQDLNVTDVFYKGKLVDRNAPIRVKTCGRALKHTVHLDKVKAEQFVLPIGKKKTHVIGINPSQITTEDLAVSLRLRQIMFRRTAIPRLRLWSGIIIPEKSALQWQRATASETAQWHLLYPTIPTTSSSSGTMTATWHWQWTKSSERRAVIPLWKTARYSKRCRFRSWD